MPLTRITNDAIAATAQINAESLTTGTIPLARLSAANSSANGILTTATQSLAGDKTFINNVTVTGNLTVLGTSVTLNSENVLIKDNILTLSSNVTGTPVLDAGIEVNRGTSANVTVKWDETSDIWQLTNDGTNYGNILTTLSSTGVNASALSTGTVPLGRLSSANSSANGIVDTTTQTFAGLKTFNSNVTFSGSRTFFASGSVLDWNSGDVTLTHSANTLTFAGASSGYIFNDGNVGIGVTPFGKLSINSNGAPASSGNMTTGLTVSNGTGGTAINIGTNDGGGYSYIQSAYVNNAGVGIPLAFFTAGTERMRIDSSGNLLVGTTSALGKTTITGSASATTFDALVLQNTDNSLSGQGARLVFKNSVTGGVETAKYGYISYIATSNYGEQGALTFGTNNGFGVAPVERARITSSGDITIASGDISLAAGKLLKYSATRYITPEDNVQGIRLKTDGGIVFEAGSSERARITIGGNVAIGATAKLYLDGVAATGDTYIEEASANLIRITTGGIGRVDFDANGIVPQTLGTTATAANLVCVGAGFPIVRSTSSIRYKHDIDTLDSDQALAAVMAMRPVTYRGKTDDDPRRFVGFIAEEMQEIAPLLCTYDEGGESGTPNYVTYDRVTAYLVAVVQQQQAKIAALEARLAALEA